MKASVKGKYDGDKSTGVGSLSFNAGDFKLRVTMTDATLVTGPTLNGLSVAAEKPGYFMVEYNVPKKDVRFQFMNKVRIAEKPLNLTYIHSRADHRTVVDGRLLIDPANKLSVNHMVGTNNCKLMYTYAEGKIATFEPCYDFAKNAWDFAVSRRVYGYDVLKATFRPSSRLLGMEWSRTSKSIGSFKVNITKSLYQLE